MLFAFIYQQQKRMPLLGNFNWQLPANKVQNVSMFCTDSSGRDKRRPLVFTQKTCQGTRQYKANCLFQCYTINELSPTCICLVCLGTAQSVTPLLAVCTEGGYYYFILEKWKTTAEHVANFIPPLGQHTLQFMAPNDMWTLAKLFSIHKVIILSIVHGAIDKHMFLLFLGCEYDS